MAGAKPRNVAESLTPRPHGQRRASATLFRQRREQRRGSTVIRLARWFVARQPVHRRESHKRYASEGFALSALVRWSTRDELECPESARNDNDCFLIVRISGILSFRRSDASAFRRERRWSGRRDIAEAVFVNSLCAKYLILRNMLSSESLTGLDRT
jgi:hypothetical protein